jgi:O-antigen/teichoic acid export membrane protein
MIPELVGLGIKFFVLQLSGLILFTTSNLLISNLFGPNEVTPYQIVYKYFSFILMLVSIVITPIWSATTDAYVRGDYSWIKSLTKRMLKVLCLFTLLVILLGVISPWVYPYWTLGKVDIPIPMTILMGIYIIVVIFSLYFANILYGTGKIFVQMIVTLSEAIMFIPLAIYCGKIMGINGIIIALILSNIPCAITNTIQYYKIINQRATGVWNR